jgi:hypothetical protein
MTKPDKADARLRREVERLEAVCYDSVPCAVDVARLDRARRLLAAQEDATERRMGMLRAAIRALDMQVEPRVNADEREALLEILHVEGFGGREDNVATKTEAEYVAIERLLWLRGQRQEGMR